MMSNSRRLPAPDPAVQAQWNLLSDLENSAARAFPSADIDARLAVCRLLSEVRARVHAPRELAVEVGRALVEMRASWQRAESAKEDAVRLAERVLVENTALRRQLAEYEDDPLQDRIEALLGERDRCRRERAQAQGQAYNKSLALRQAQAEIAGLQQTIADLNRIIVEQQGQLNEMQE